VIGDSANRDGEHSHPGLDALIECSLYSRSHVLETLRRLRAEGWVEVEEERAPGRATVFRIPGVLDPDWQPNKVRNPDLNGAAKGPIDEPIRSDLDPHKVRSSENAPYIATVSNGNTNGSTAPPVDVAEAPTFERFWEGYPRRDGKRIGRGEAERVWRRLSKSDRADALAAVVHYAEACELGTHRAKDAHRWLVGRAWLDWSTPVVPDAPRGPARRGSTTDTALAMMRRLQAEEGER
jgi:hypothetical protein